MRSPWPRSILLALLLSVRTATAEDDCLPSVSLAGTLTLTDTATGGDDPITGLSGITWLGDDRYAAVLDNSDRLLLFRLTLAASGVPTGLSDLRTITLGEHHDYEDVSTCPPALVKRIAARRRARGDTVPDTCLLVCEEDTPAIRAIDLERGDLLGIVPIPDLLRTRRHQRGLESLAVDPDGRFIWTATEEALPADGPSVSDSEGTVVRLTRIAVPDAGGDGRDAQFAYAVDPPHTFARVLYGQPLAGLVALASLGEGRLLSLERSAAPGLPPFTSRIALVDTAAAEDVSDLAGDLAIRPELAVPKITLWQEALGCNLEGLCIGPRLPDGRRMLVAVADNGGLGTPSQLVALVLDEPRATIDASGFAAAAAIAGAALLVLRLTSPSPCSTR